jgi:hypothetical protein
MLTFITILIMLVVAYAYLAEGLFTACTMCINVFIAGLLAFNFFEPIASSVEPMVYGTFLGGYEDAVCLVAIFSLALYALRSVTNQLAKAEVDFPLPVQRAGGAAFGALTGYLVAGFLICAIETIPLHARFLGFDPGHDPDKFMRRYLPSDHMWLALMHRAGTHAFANWPPETFDRHGNYDLRYARYRRYDEGRMGMEYYGEFDRELFEQFQELPTMPAPGPPPKSAPPPAAPPSGPPQK